MPIHFVCQGEWLALIASRYGVSPNKVWEHPENAALRQRKRTPNILHPGDHIYIPERTLASVSATTEARHRFRTRTTPTYLRIMIQDPAGHPYAQKRYRLQFDTEVLEGDTDRDGWISVVLPDGSSRGRLQVWVRDNNDFPPLRWQVWVGALNPRSEITGVQARLRNLGFDVGPTDGVIGPRTRKAIRQFRLRHRLTEGDDINDSLIDHLNAVHRAEE